MYDYAYFAASLIFLTFWLFCFILLKTERKAMLWTSAIFASAGPISEFWHLQDYWHPVYLVDIRIGDWLFGVEDFITTFSLAGMAAGVFEWAAKRKEWPALPAMSMKAFLKMHGWGLLGLVTMAFCFSVLSICSIHAILLTLLLCSTTMLFGKWQIVKLVLPLSLMYGILYWLFLVFIFMKLYPGVIPALWKLQTTWDLMLAGVPVEELLWGMTIMLFGGPVIRMNSFFPAEK
jgi:hypothetical protein